MTIGPLAPPQERSVFFAFSADDVLLHFSEDQLNDKQRADKDTNYALMCACQVSLLAVGKGSDHVALFDEFEAAPWKETVRRYQGWFAEILGEAVPPEHVHFLPRERFYEEVARRTDLAELLNLYLLSGNNAHLHQDENDLEVSRRVNSKMHLANVADRYHLPVPTSLVCTKRTLGTGAVADFFAVHPQGVMLKLMGLSGARNVTAIADLTAAEDYLAPFADDVELVLQEKLSLEEWTEMTVDLTVTDTGVTISNVRRILFADGLWIGNLLGEVGSLGDRQRTVLEQVGEYARAEGYSSSLGWNCGVDFFVRGDEILVIEVNARWTGGLFPTQVARKAGLGARDTVVFFDQISKSRLDGYLDFIDDHLLGRGEADFAIVPLGFSPDTLPSDGDEWVYVWQMVDGDFEAFQRAKNESLAIGEMPAADAIVLPER